MWTGEAVEATSELFAQYGYNQGVVVEEAIIPQPGRGLRGGPDRAGAGAYIHRG